MVAPLIGMALSPIVSALFEKGLTLLGNAVMAKGEAVIEEKLGVKLDAKDITDNALKWKQIETDHEQFLIKAAQDKAELELEGVKVANDNTQGARVANTSIQQTENTTRFVKEAAYYLDFLIVAATVIMAFALFMLKIPVENKEIAYMVFGSLVTMSGTVLNFHRGSSAKSQGKDDTIRSLATK
jgi:hypothetical protein